MWFHAWTSLLFKGKLERWVTVDYTFPYALPVRLCPPLLSWINEFFHAILEVIQGPDSIRVWMIDTTIQRTIHRIIQRKGSLVLEERAPFTPKSPSQTLFNSKGPFGFPIKIPLRKHMSKLLCRMENEEIHWLTHRIIHLDPFLEKGPGWCWDRAFLSNWISLDGSMGKSMDFLIFFWITNPPKHPFTFPSKSMDCSVDHPNVYWIRPQYSDLTNTIGVGPR